MIARELLLLGERLFSKSIELAVGYVTIELPVPRLPIEFETPPAL